MTWLGPPKNVTIIHKEGPFSSSKEIDISVEVEDQAWFSESRIHWVIYGTDTPTWDIARAIDPDTAYVNSDDRIRFRINKHILTATGDYRIYLRLYAKRFDQPLVFQQDTLV